MGECPPRVVTAGAAATTPLMIHASITGRRERRRGRSPPPSGGQDRSPREDTRHPRGRASPPDSGMPFEAMVCGRLPRGARSRLSPLGTCVAKPAGVACVAALPESSASPNPSASPPAGPATVGGVAGMARLAAAVPGPGRRPNARMIDSGRQFDVGCRASTCGPGDAEVDNPWAVLHEQHVRRLEVPVRHACGVDRDQMLVRLEPGVDTSVIACGSATQSLPIALRACPAGGPRVGIGAGRNDRGLAGPIAGQ